MKVFGYCRVSGPGQVHGDGFPRQEAAMRSYAKAQNVEIIEIFHEKGVSGTIDNMDRPVWAQIVSRILETGEVEGILIEKLDRLARHLMVQEVAVDHLVKLGIKLVSVMEPDLCSDDPARVMLRQMMGVIAQYEKSMIVRRTKAARERIRSTKGRCEGRKPFGVKEGEGSTLARIYEMDATGFPLGMIADHLNMEQRKTREGKKWHKTTVSRILKRQQKEAA